MHRVGGEECVVNRKGPYHARLLPMHARVHTHTQRVMFIYPSYSAACCAEARRANMDLYSTGLYDAMLRWTRAVVDVAGFLRSLA